MDEVDALAPPPDDPLIPLPSSVLWFLLTTVEAGQRTILPAHLNTADTLTAFDALDEGWILFAREIYAVPRPTVPSSVVLAALGAIVFANVVAAIPGRVAARTPAALVLRTE